MIDAHILVLESTPCEWVTQCIDSVCRAVANAPFHVNLRVREGVVNGTGTARAKAYKEGTEPYVVAVDDDDWVSPDFFQVLDPALLVAGVSGALIRETHVVENRHYPKHTHHKMAAVRRDVVENAGIWGMWRGEGGQVLRAVYACAPYVDIVEWVYFRRVGRHQR